MNRRTFIRNTAIASLSMLLPFPAFAEDKKPKKNWIWTSAGADFKIDDWKQRFARFKKNGLDAALVGGSFEFYTQAAQAAKNEGIELHAWIWTLNRGNEELMKNHPDWYAVSRLGESVIDKPPYVDYYRWLCPSKAEVAEYISNDYVKFAQIEGLAGVHLDYVRYCDVILPIALQPKYNLVQDHEMPQFDFCYCQTCRTEFEKKHGIDPLKIENPAENKEWLQYRYDTVSVVVKKIIEAVHTKTSKVVTAAVFPTPTIARTLVRQDWDKWALDAVMPMIYHSFYNEKIEWIKQAAQEGVSAINGKFPHYSGLFIPFLNPAELAHAVQLSMEGGSKGVAIFSENDMSKKHWKEFKAAVKGE